ncbi:hypothetical protein A6R68_19712, partial [Neotoma lepida]
MELPPPGIRRVSISNPQETPRRFSTFPSTTPTHSSLASAGTLKLSTQSSMKSQSLMPNPILQKSSLGPPEAMPRRGSNVSSVHYADEQGKALSESDKDKEKAKEKDKGKGTGSRLLNMLRKTLQGSQSEEMVVAQEIPNLIPFGDVQHVNMFIRVSINHIVKCTKLRNLRAVNNEKNLVLRFDEVKYFSVQVPRRQDDERNNIFLELMQDGGNFICRVEVEFMFSYGNFGYGFSHQLKPLQKIIEPSMFMKIAPPPERTDPVTNVITPQRIEYPAFLSPELNVTIGSADANQPTAVQLEKLREKPRERSAYHAVNIVHFMDKSGKEGLVIPVLKVLDQDPSEPFLYKKEESILGDTLLPPIHALHIRGEIEASHLPATLVWEEDSPKEERSLVLSLDEQLSPKRPSILRIASSLQESCAFSSLVKELQASFPQQYGLIPGLKANHTGNWRVSASQPTGGLSIKRKNFLIFQ